MKHILNPFAVMALALAMTAGCGKSDAPPEAAVNEAPAKPAAPEKPVVLNAALDIGAAVKDADDTRYKGLTMTGPEGSSVVDSGMGLTVKWGELQFALRLPLDGDSAVAKAKKAAEANKRDTVLLDTPDAVLWSSKSLMASSGDPDNHSFVATVKVGDKTLVCKNKGYGKFTKAQAEALLKTCQSAKL